MTTETSGDAFDDDRDPSRTGDAPSGVDDGGAAPYETPEELEQRINDLEDELEEKEQLVRALTERLEQAAEQLDRLHRTGADRKRVIGGGGGMGLPPELVEEQRELVNTLSQAVEQWQSMQAEAALGRIEMELHELRQLFDDRIPPGGMAAAPAESLERQAAPTPTPKRQQPPAGSSYEAIKAAMFGDDESVHDEPEPTPSPSNSAALSSILGEEEPEEFDADPPPDVDFDTASRSELVEAIAARDEYIATLIRKLRTARSQHLAPPDWESLNDAPEELCSRLMKLEKLLQESLKQAEIEISVERARLGRERMRLAMQQEELQRKPNAGSPTAADGEAEDHLDRTDRRWMKFLGGK